MAILLANAVMAIAQVNVASVYLSISVTFDEQITGLGILTALLFVGLGLAEIPGGLLSSRTGPKKVTLAAIATVALASLASGYSPSFDALLILRFFVGVGLGLFFPSMVVLAIRSTSKGASGMGVGLVGVSGSLGGGLGTLSWSVLGAVYGWRTSLFLDASLTAAVGVLVFLMVPSDQRSATSSLSLSDFREIIARKKLVMLCLCLFGIGASGSLIGNFMVYYLEKDFGIQPGYAGFITAIGWLSLIFGSLLGGRLYDKGSHTGLLIFASTAAYGVSTIIVGVHSLYAATLGAVAWGFTGGMCGTAAIAAAKKLAPDAHLEALTIGMCDSFSLLGNFASGLYFPLLVLSLGYPLGWAIGGSVCIFLALPLVLFKDM
ncbi:MAG: MFS transporter [Thaumarchaeota archaeon]|nr:MFS transporter [Nitrososphaerota archaeon]